MKACLLYSLQRLILTVLNVKVRPDPRDVRDAFPTRMLDFPASKLIFFHPGILVPRSSPSLPQESGSVFTRECSGCH